MNSLCSFSTVLGRWYYTCNGDSDFFIAEDNGKLILKVSMFETTLRGELIMEVEDSRWEAKCVANGHKPYGLVRIRVIDDHSLTTQC